MTLVLGLGIGPSLFYRWQKEFFENGHAAFESNRKSKAVEDAKQRVTQPVAQVMT